MSWTTAPDNIGTLKFKIVKDGEERVMIVKSDGIYPPPHGLIIIFR